MRDLTERLPAHWPDVEINIRGDSGFVVPAMFDVCEELEIQYTFGIQLNNVLKR